MARAINADIDREVDETGRVWFHGKDAVELLLRGYNLLDLLFHSTPEIDIYNQNCARFDKTTFQIRSPGSINVAEDAQRRLQTWWITEPFVNLPVRETVLQWCSTDQERDRVNLEMDLFEARGLIPVLRLIFMLVDHFRRNNIVWGVGRGSSVASYVLFRIGVHRVDALKYQLDIHEFLK
jgi:hypothetical protein